MGILIELILFLFAVPVLLIYSTFSIFRSIAEFFGWTFIPGVISLYLGAIIGIYGQQNPDSQFDNVFQMLNRISLLGAPLYWILVFAGVGLLVYGVRTHYKRQG